MMSTSRNHNSSSPPSIEEDESAVAIDPEKLLSFGSKQIISLFVPVSICMLLVGVVAKTVSYYSTTDSYLIYTPFHTKDADIGTTIWQSLANALIMISLVVVMSIVLVLLYKYRCYKVIHGYLIVSTIIILFVLFTMFFVEVVIAANIFMDYFTLSLFIWNFGVVGFLVIHWKGPLILQQAYLIVISAKVALILLKFMPQWTTWVVLGVLAIWDLIAVLCPFGPLRMLVEIASERNEPIFPALIYSTTATVMVSESEDKRNENDNGDGGGSAATASADTNLQSAKMPSASVTEPPQVDVIEGRTKRSRTTPSEQTNHATGDMESHTVTATNTSVDQNRGTLPNDRKSRMRRNIQEINDDVIDRGDRGVKLGLGDFVFYSLLMGRATLDSDPNTILACYVSILVGMFLTILLLTVAGRALPALPISMACGILFYFLTSMIISPFTVILYANRAFI